MKILLVAVIYFVASAALALPEAKLEAKPFEAEQNFRLLKKTMETGSDAKKVVADDNTLGSGGWNDEYEDDDYDYKDEDDDEGSGLSSDFFGSTETLHKKQEDKAKLKPDTAEDFHFEDAKKKKEDPYKDILYEYYNEILYGDEDDELDYSNQAKQDTTEPKEKEDEATVVANNNSSSNFDLTSPSYIFLMLASAFISFAVFTVAFFLCRKTMRKNKEKKAALAPFTGASSILRTSGPPHSTPIVKNYQRVPTSTMEMMSNQVQQEKAEMGMSETQRPLLT